MPKKFSVSPAEWSDYTRHYQTGHYQVFVLLSDLSALPFSLFDGIVMSSDIKLQIDTEVKSAMRARDKQRLGVLRLTMSELKKVEVDERIELDDQRVLAILDKMSKQRKDSLSQYTSAGRDDLAAQESFELKILKEFMPEQLSATELKTLVDAAIAEAGATSVRDMGKVMGILKPQVQGRADMGEVGSLVKADLG
jgi:uncharacterized protein YqeY